MLKLRVPIVSTTEELRASYERIWTTTDMYETHDYYAKCLDLAAPKKGERLLDVACGGGYLLQVADRKGLVTSGVDIADAAIERTRTIVPRADLRRGEAEALPYPDGTFDIVTCPSLSTVTRSASANTSVRSWEMSRTLTPCPASLRTTPASRSTSTRERDDVGSSRTSTSALSESALAISTSWRSAIDRSLTFAVGLMSPPTISR